MTVSDDFVQLIKVFPTAGPRTTVLWTGPLSKSPLFQLLQKCLPFRLPNAIQLPLTSCASELSVLPTSFNLLS